MKKSGEILKETRINKGYSISDIVVALRVRYSFIEAIENCDYSILSEYIYTLGYIASYAKFLKLDVEQVVELAKGDYKKWLQGSSKVMYSQHKKIKSIKLYIIDFVFLIFNFTNKKQAKETQNIKIVKKNKKPIYISYSIILLFLMIIIVGGWFFSHKVSKVTIKSHPIAIDGKVTRALGMKTEQIDKIINSSDSNASKSDNNISKNVPDHSLTSQAMVLSKKATHFNKLSTYTKTSKVKLVFTEKVWIKLYNAEDRSIIYQERIYNKGESLIIPDVPYLQIDIGNYHGVYISLTTANLNHRNLYLTSINDKSHVIKNIRLNVKSLLKQFGINK